MPDFHEIGEDELFYRKVPVSTGWYDPKRRELKPEALKPRETDTIGISFDRAKSTAYPLFRSLEEAAQGQSKKGYYVAVFRAGDLRSTGFTLEADPIEGNPGHALLLDLTFSNRKETASQSKMVLLAHKLVSSVEGPFVPQAGKGQ